MTFLLFPHGALINIKAPWPVCLITFKTPPRPPPRKHPSITCKFRIYPGSILGYSSNWLTSLKWLASFKHSWCIYQRRAPVRPWINPLCLKNNIQSIIKISRNHPRTGSPVDMIDDAELVDSMKILWRASEMCFYGWWPAFSSRRSSA